MHRLAQNSVYAQCFEIKIGFCPKTGMLEHSQLSTSFIRIADSTASFPSNFLHNFPQFCFYAQSGGRGVWGKRE
jgi:hypothetical protein